MEHDENDGFEEIKLEPIPNVFYSDGDKAPFKCCTFCGEELSELGSYLIEKSLKKHPGTSSHVTVFEYAICTSCNQKKMEAMSEESVANIKRYMEENLVMEAWERFKERGEDDPLNKCIVTGKSRDELDEYNIVGQFIGDYMISGPFPILISPQIGEEIQELLSEQTKKEFDDFMDTITGVPPELKALFKTRRPVLV